MNKFNLSEEDWETVKKLADEMLVMFEGLPVWQVIHALEMVYAYLGVTTNVSFQTMMNKYSNCRFRLDNSLHGLAWC